MALILLEEYARRVGKKKNTLTERIKRGTLPAVKIGRQWFIEEDTELIDYRVTSNGKYADWRKKYSNHKEDPSETV